MHGEEKRPAADIEFLEAIDRLYQFDGSNREKFGHFVTEKKNEKHDLDIVQQHVNANLKKPAALNAHNKFGPTVFTMAIDRNLGTLIDMLVQIPGIINNPDGTGATPLMVASRLGY